MIAKSSLLDWKQFAVLDFSLQSKLPEPGEELINTNEYFNGYDIDIDFHSYSIDENIFHVVVQININRSHDSLGYSISIVCVGEFDIHKINQIPDPEDLKSLIGSSTLNMMIGRMRAILYQNTSSSALGPYELPSIDLGDLIQQKKEQIKSESLSK